MAKPNNTAPVDVHPNNLNSGTTLKGDLICNGDIRIAGTLEGTITSQGKVVVSTTGVVKGEITCKNSQVEGKIEGKITVSELLSLKATASILGDIDTKKLAIEPGANFTGSCKMNGSSSSQPIFDNDKKK